MVLGVVTKFGWVVVRVSIETIAINMTILILLFHIIIAGSSLGRAYWDSLNIENAPNFVKMLRMYLNLEPFSEYLFFTDNWKFPRNTATLQASFLAVQPTAQ